MLLLVCVFHCIFFTACYAVVASALEIGLSWLPWIHVWMSMSLITKELHQVLEELNCC
ncbi:hypothetical protein M758_UG296600 [Ceratodon purpureus]|nr:hypothetical protein M758_UG296600 [Ceratodon purpureus]